MAVNWYDYGTDAVVDYFVFCLLIFWLVLIE